MTRRQLLKNLIAAPFVAIGAAVVAKSELPRPVPKYERFTPRVKAIAWDVKPDAGGDPYACLKSPADMLKRAHKAKLDNDAARLWEALSRSGYK